MADEKLSKSKLPAYHFHRFLDEAGDTTFYGKGKIPMIGSDGVSNYFLLGMLSVNQPLDEVRKAVIALQDSIVNDPYFLDIPSIKKKKSANGYFLHAKDDIPEVRKLVFELIKSIDCRFDAVVGKKDYRVYEKNTMAIRQSFMQTCYPIFCMIA
jgi:hypothetical protein